MKDKFRGLYVQADVPLYCAFCMPKAGSLRLFLLDCPYRKWQNTTKDSEFVRKYECPLPRFQIVAHCLKELLDKKAKKANPSRRYAADMFVCAAVGLRLRFGQHRKSLFYSHKPFIDNHL
jgi:hypothetical protein